MDRTYTLSDYWIIPAGVDDWEIGLRHKTRTSLGRFSADGNGAESLSDFLPAHHLGNSRP